MDVDNFLSIYQNHCDQSWSCPSNLCTLCPCHGKRVECEQFLSARKICVRSTVQYSFTKPFNIDQFHLISSLPWDQSSYVGYFGEIFFTILFAYGYLILHGVSLILFISMCLHHRAFSEIFKRLIDAARQCDENSLHDLIGFHLTAKEYVIRRALTVD